MNQFSNINCHHYVIGQSGVVLYHSSVTETPLSKYLHTALSYLQVPRFKKQFFRSQKWSKNNYKTHKWSIFFFKSRIRFVQLIELTLLKRTYMSTTAGSLYSKLIRSRVQLVIVRWLCTDCLNSYSIKQRVW